MGCIPGLLQHNRKEFIMSDKLWKATEREVSRLLGGKRVPVNSTDGIECDVKHDWLAIEVKERKNLPAFLVNAMRQAVKHSDDKHMPIVVFHGKSQRHDNDLIVIRLRDFCDNFVGEVKE